MISAELHAGGGEEALEGVAGLFLVVEDTGLKNGIGDGGGCVLPMQREPMRVMRDGMHDEDFGVFGDGIVGGEVVAEMGEGGEDIGGEAVLAEEGEIGFSHGEEVMTIEDC